MIPAGKFKKESRKYLNDLKTLLSIESQLPIIDA
jgi:hypothetical protein